jgi:hypothetical protein
MPRKGVNHTISSLQIGQESWAPGAAGAADIEVSPFSKEMREVRSWASEDNCDTDACEFRETLLAAGESTLLGCGDGAAARALGLPRTRPPPSVLRDMIRAWEAKREAVSAQHSLAVQNKARGTVRGKCQL